MAANALLAQADYYPANPAYLDGYQNFVSTAPGYGTTSYQTTGTTSGDALYGGTATYGTTTATTSVNNAAAAAGYGLLGGAVGYGSAADYNAANYGVYGGAAGYGSAADYSAANYSTAVQQYATDAQGLFQDANPQIIRRPAPGGNLTYTQNVRVRFLQPPPVPPHGPLIIKEVRPPQPPVPPPLRRRQQAPPLPQPPALVLREQPPVPPATIASQTVIRRLAAIPVPPRSVVTERLPAAPARPRDIVIERWIPYGAQAARRTIVQRAGPAYVYQQPRNVIVQYDQAPARIVRQFQRLGVTAESPAAYVQRYGGSLLNSGSLVSQARAAGVVEDISPPGFVGSYASGASQYASAAGLGYGAGVYGYDAADLAAYNAAYGGVGVVEGAGLGGTTTYQSSSYSTTAAAPAYDAGYGYADAGFVDGGYQSYGNSYATTSDADFVGAADGYVY